jgi:ribA/ribD-fused uncharacterized protein
VPTRLLRPREALSRLVGGLAMSGRPDAGRDRDRATPMPDRWAVPGALYFWGGPLSNFAPTPGLSLPEGWCRHPCPPARVSVATVEHYFQACKATSRSDFVWILSAPTAASAKRRGSRAGERGRRIPLRGDWEAVKIEVMRLACRAKFALPAARETLLSTGNRCLVEDSPHDFEWGGRDGAGGYGGMNRLGVILMAIREEARIPASGRDDARSRSVCGPLPPP